ncbi:MAG: arginine deiminase family protein [Candidatus Omnitrophota bacterium]
MMFPHTIGSEYKPLKAVLLYKPGPFIENIDIPRDVLHLGRISYSVLTREYAEMINAYKKLKIKTYFINVDKTKNDGNHGLFNLMFVRDLFLMTPSGAIISKMFSEVRRPEERYAKMALSGMGVRIRKIIRDGATFEGADALWLNNRLMVVGVGKRTNIKGFREVKEELKKDNIECLSVPAPQGTLHLLGALQFVDSALALVRVDLVDSDIVNFLKQNKIKIIKIPENAEVRKKQAMNFVAIAPRKIVMPADCPKTRRIYERFGIKIAAEVKITQLVNGGGGLACATGILTRKPNNKVSK